MLSAKQLRPPKGSDQTPWGLGKRLYSDIKADLLSLHLPPGTELQEQELAQRYGGSRTPVREALSRLMADGLVERVGRAYRARQFLPLEVRDVYEMREALEEMTVRLCTERAEEADLAALDRLLEEQQRAIWNDDRLGFSEKDSAFHASIARAGRNALLASQVSLLQDQIRIIRARELDRALGRETALADHRRILDAMRRREVAVAQAEMRSHIRQVMTLFDEPPGAPSSPTAPLA
jgi:DNA-binding GntR family transcriptional regulator